MVTAAAEPTTEEQIETVSPNDKLGPTMTAEFQGAQSLDELVTQKSGPPPKAQAPTPEAVIKLDRTIFGNTIKQLDTTVSALVGVDPEDTETLQPTVDGLYPLAEYYASQEATVTTLWILAGITLLSFATLKQNKVRQLKLQKDGTNEQVS